MNIEETVRKVNAILKNDEDYKDDNAMQVQYILLNKENQIDDIVCYGWDGMVSVDSKTFEIDTISDWAYSYDMDLFEQLRDGKTIGYMTAEIHYDIWREINDLYPEDIDCKEGLELYIKYCDEKGITKEYLDQRMKLDTPDIMDKFFNLEVGNTLEYKGYIAYVDSHNLDNNKENIIYMYKNKQDYISGEYIESVSLNKEKLKKNIKSYIDETYSPKMNKNINYDSEKAYFTFVLGYDLLHDMLSQSSTPENDISYDFCNMIAEEFLKSEEYKNEKYSAYEMLDKWVNKNEIDIRKNYKEFSWIEKSKKTRELDNAIVLDVGYRRKEPIALVERKMKDEEDEKQYVVAFGYKITDNEITWNYGYYYYNDLKKAKHDFDKVINGGTLVYNIEER